MIPPVRQDPFVQQIQMMNSLSDSILDIHFQYFRHPLLPRWDAGHKNTNTDYCDAVLSHSLFRYRGVTRDGNPHPY